MSIGEAIEEIRKTIGLSQSAIAKACFIDRSYISRIENGQYPFPETADSRLARINWRFALTIMDERTGGYVSNLLEDVPNIDLHPLAIKEALLKDLEEAVKGLEELRLAKHLDHNKRKQSAEKVWQEIKDVVDKGVLMQGVLEEEFGLDRERLIKKHEMEVKQGER